MSGHGILKIVGELSEARRNEATFGFVRYVISETDDRKRKDCSSDNLFRRCAFQKWANCVYYVTLCLCYRFHSILALLYDALSHDVIANKSNGIITRGMGYYLTSESTFMTQNTYRRKRL